MADENEITAVAVTTLRRQYPHVDTVTDFSTQQSLKLLWDRIFALQEQLTAAQGTITRLVTGHNADAEDIERALRRANDALAIAQQPSEAEGGGGGGGGDGDLGDMGAFQEGIDAGLPSGHDSGGEPSALRAGQITGGTGNEFIALRNPTPTVEERLANAEELLLRIIWHLHEAGFEAGKQRNPSGLVSRDKMAVVVDGVLRAYDIFISFDDNTIQMQMSGQEVTPANLVAEGGIPDS